MAGNNWTARTSAGSRKWWRMAASADGSGWWHAPTIWTIYRYVYTLPIPAPHGRSKRLRATDHGWAWRSAPMGCAWRRVLSNRRLASGNSDGVGKIITSPMVVPLGGSARLLVRERGKASPCPRTAEVVGSQRHAFGQLPLHLHRRIAHLGGAHKCWQQVQFLRRSHVVADGRDYFGHRRKHPVHQHRWWCHWTTCSGCWQQGREDHLAVSQWANHGGC